MPMRKSRFTDEQIAFALKQAETGTPVLEVCRKMGVSEQTYYRWKKPDIAIIDGSGYRMSYGETTKCASEASVLNATTLPRRPDGAGGICDPN